MELDVALGGRGVQYREVQGNETEKFLSYFKPCIIPEEGGIASGFRHTEINEREHVTRLFVCRGKHTVHVKEVDTFFCVPCSFFLNVFVTLFFHGDDYQICMSHCAFPQQVPFARSSLNHDDIFILDTKSKIFQFNGSNSSIQERAKALEVVQYLKDTNHEGKCDVAAVGKFTLQKTLLKWTK